MKLVQWPCHKDILIANIAGHCLTYLVIPFATLYRLQNTKYSDATTNRNIHTPKKTGFGQLDQSGLHHHRSTCAASKAWASCSHPFYEEKQNEVLQTTERSCLHGNQTTAGSSTFDHKLSTAQLLSLLNSHGHSIANRLGIV